LRACVFAAVIAVAGLALQGDAQGQQIDWNARAPWGPQDHNEPVELQKHEPYKIFDNVWYVGIQTAAVYLLPSPAGHFLFDATADETAHLVLDNIRKAGFNPRDIKYLIITHAHLDHFGGAEQVRQATGARVGMSLEDWKQTEQLQDAAVKALKPGQKPALRIARDLVLEDGQTLTLGDNTLKFYITPGHTPGATSTEFRARDGNRTYRVIVPGGLGFPNAQWTPAYLKSIERLKALGPWDSMLPNHGDMMTPKRMRDLEAAIRAHRPGQPHPAVQGAAALNAWFDAIIKVTNEKIASDKAASR
jgi:glyoxylase-like metal-dependent hydrolase (beta-lactamase superfamily II)